MNLSYFLFKKQFSLPRYVLYKECYVVLQPLLLITHFSNKTCKTKPQIFPICVIYTIVFSSMYSFDAICQVVLFLCLLPSLVTGHLQELPHYFFFKCFGEF